MHRFTVATGVCLALALGAAPASAKHFWTPPNPCVITAFDMLAACGNDVRDELFTKKAQCLNLTDKGDREECYGDASDEREENAALCGEQYQARVDFCEALGEDRYDPEVNPADYETDFMTPSNPNPYYPIAIGDHWEFASSDETTEVDVLDKTKLIQGVHCVVVKDVVKTDGAVSEDTDDWIGLRLDRAVDYFGELSLDSETFAGDDPEEPELVAIDGSFKAGRDGAKKGSVFLAAPAVGDVYREEWALGEAEDGAKILATDYGYGGDPELEVPEAEALIEHLCANDCVVTENFTPIEPDALEHKYYAPGIGVFLEVDLVTGDVNKLVGCNVDPKCATLP